MLVLILLPILLIILFIIWAMLKISSICGERESQEKNKKANKKIV